MTSDPLVGRVVDGRYRVVSRIARGGMATVYLAVDQRLDREVALKIMHAHLADGTEGVDFTSRFRREARAAARLAHPGLVAVFDQGVDGETSYLTMEYVDGANLRRTLHHTGTFTVAQTLDTLEAILDALAAAHRAGLVHRDIKPENVLVDTAGRVKVTDFGLARAVTEATTTTTGTVLGTVAYMAPEVIRAVGCDARSDVYSVGILAYEMLVGVPPHGGDTPIQVAFQHVNHDVPTPSGAVPALPVEIDELVCALAARDPQDRPVDAGAALHLVRSTRAALDPADLDVRRESAPRPTSEGDASLDAIPTTVFGALDDETRAVAIARAGGTRALELIGTGAETESVPRPRRRRASKVLVWLLVVLLVVAGAGGGGVWWFTRGPGAYTSVPDDLVGATRAEASERVGAAGLDVTTSEAHDDDVPAGAVVATDPGEGERVRKDGSVGLVLSLGVEMLTVPDDLVGESEADAADALTTAGFELGEAEHTFDDDAPTGSVVDVSVPEGTQQRHDTVVVLTVSDGPAPVTVPAVTGLEKSAAVDQLTGAGLDVSTTEAYDEKVPSGEVVSQSLEADSQAHRGDEVSVVVSKGPPLVEVPKVVDMKVEDATATLEKAGFTVEISELFGTRPLDRVLFQDQDPGAEIPKGSTVKLTVT